MELWRVMGECWLVLVIVEPGNGFIVGFGR